MTRRRRSKSWLEKHRRDPYVRSAKRSGFRSRAAYKLEQIDARDRLFHPGHVVVDLGAAPGGWSQVAAARVAPGGRVLALDRLPMAPIAGVRFLKGDFLAPGLADTLRAALGDSRAHIVMSDMAPNISGIRDADQARSLELALSALSFAETVLATPGTFLVKAFQGPDMEELVSRLRQNFDRVDLRKPGASRDESSEVYLLARGYGVV